MTKTLLAAAKSEMIYNSNFEFGTTKTSFSAAKRFIMEKPLLAAAKRGDKQKMSGECGFQLGFWI